jgi:hypothetical protein
LAILAAGIAASAASAQVTLLGVQYRPDQAFPEYECFWNSWQYPGPCMTSSPMGATMHMYLRNNGSSTVTVQDMTLAGLSLKTCLVEQVQADSRHPYSIWFATLTPTQLQTLLNAGEPVWYKADPPTIAPGGTAQVMVRLRSVPVTSTVNIAAVHSAGTTSATVTVAADAPQVTSVGFSSDLTKVYLYWRRSDGTAPTSIYMDGTNVTASTTTVSDSTVGVATSVLQLAQPLSAMSFHVFQGVYADAKKATAGLRAWVNDFIYGTWGAQPGDDGDLDAARAWIDDATNHSVNSLVVTLGSSALGDLLKTVSGRQYAADRGYGFVIDYIDKWACQNPRMWFIRDEPDCADSRVQNLPGNKLVGSLAMSCVERGEELRADYPLAPTTLNIDSTYTPYNWYNYGQVPDVFMTDPYYQARLRETYWIAPTQIPLYEKATYIYAVSQIAQSSCAPNPLHVVLYSCEYIDPSGAIFPFPTPESKRIEVYYALAAGAKGFSYWWYLPGRPSNGLGDGGPEAQALWREIGLLGAELRTAAPLLVTSCPSTMTTQATSGIWVRPLLVGNDTVVLLVVNAQYYNDESGCHYTPVSNATVTLTLPPWLASSSAFEIAASGVTNVNTQINDNQLQVNLGTVNISRMIVVTSNALLQDSITDRYNQLVRPKVCVFAPDVCAQNTTPQIAQQPQSRSTCPDTTVTFSVVATGPGTLTYRWQKNLVNLNNGGHYSGVTTSTLTISNVDAADAASYRCVVSNEYGSTNSHSATLTVLSCNPGCLENLGFEGGFTSGIGYGWTKFVKSGDVTCSAETVEKHGGAYSQEIFSPSVENDGGVYQQFSATPGQPYTVKAWFKVYSPEGTGIAEGFLGIDPTGGTDPNSANVLWASKPYEYWSQKPWTGLAQGNFITVYLRGRSTKTADKKKTAYVWIDDIEIAPGAPTDGTPQPLSPTSIRWKWTDLTIESAYRVRDTAGVDKSGLLAADTVQWTETTGLAANTQYTRKIYASNDCGESDPSVGQTAYSLIQTPTDVTIGAITTNTIAASPAGTFTNLTLGSSGVLVANTTAGTDSGWQQTLNSWTSAGLTANTAYDFVARARNASALETADCEPVTAWTLSVPPTADSIVPGNTSPQVNENVVWTAVAEFGAGTVEYYLYAWDQNPTYTWTGQEPSWSGGTLITLPIATGTWYLHVQGRNGQDAPNGTYDYHIEVLESTTVLPDLDGDNDVDADDFALFDVCFSGPAVPAGQGCLNRDFDRDSDVDQTDFDIYQRCFSGQGNAPDPNCAD